MVKGLELAQRYYLKLGEPMIAEKFSEYKNRIAVGLVGDGSECFGFDDEISRDHDWGPGFCLWLTRGDFVKIGDELKGEINKLDKRFEGYEARNISKWGDSRVGVFEIGQFYKQFIGIDRVPETLLEWRQIPEMNLAAATNGKVFKDKLSEFTDFREGLLEFYPEDIRLKKIANRCMTMAQAGQYNYLRCSKREEYVAAQYAQSQFIEAAISMVFLLNKKYKPFYKWMHRAMKELEILGNEVYNMLLELCTLQESGYDRSVEIIEGICQLVIKELSNQNLSYSESDFLLNHAPIVQGKILDPKIRGMHILSE